ncbi:MAG: hypothetical protein ACI4V5_04140 [Prevotella sp.]
MNTVEVDCNQKTEGLIMILFSIIMMMFHVTYWLTACMDNLIATSILLITPIVLFGLGIWFYRFKKTPRKIDVIIGGFANKIYTRNKLLFIIYEIAIYGILLLVLKIIIQLTENNDLAEAFTATGKNLLHYSYASLIVAYKTTQDYLGYYCYYKTIPTRQ